MHGEAPGVAADLNNVHALWICRGYNCMSHTKAAIRCMFGPALTSVPMANMLPADEWLPVRFNIRHANKYRD